MAAIWSFLPRINAGRQIMSDMFIADIQAAVLFDFGNHSFFTAAQRTSIASPVESSPISGFGGIFGYWLMASPYLGLSES